MQQKTNDPEIDNQLMAELIETLIQAAIDAQMLPARDSVYVRNQVMSLMSVEAVPNKVSAIESWTIADALDTLIAYAAKCNIINDEIDHRDQFASKIMNCFLPQPSAIEAEFARRYKHSIEAATSYFYELSKNSQYIQTNRIKKNVQFNATTPFGTIDLSINLAKPEKDPEEIKRERSQNLRSSYPSCLLCIENEGYAGRMGYPGRSNHRVIKLFLEGEEWYFQYSPYLYYNEHSIVFSASHRPMQINHSTFNRLLAFTEQFPHYFIGSNADLPIVGGSILSHDHYQAGRYEFPMAKANDVFTFSLNQFKEINCSVLHWPLSVIRLRGKDRFEVADAANEVLQKWIMYSDEGASLIAYTGQERHNTITPIARRRNHLFELDLILRNNRTSTQHPLGIFHPHDDVHPIKKENIGLIEAMGVAILPPRLKGEFAVVKQYLLGYTKSVDPIHQEWAQRAKQTYGVFLNEAEADAVIQKETAKLFIKGLTDAGVFKNENAFKRFIDYLG